MRRASSHGARARWKARCAVTLVVSEKRAIYRATGCRRVRLSAYAAYRDLARLMWIRAYPSREKSPRDQYGYYDGAYRRKTIARLARWLAWRDDAKLREV